MIGAYEYDFPREGIRPAILLGIAGCLVATGLCILNARALMEPLWKWLRGARSREAAERVWSTSSERLPAVVLLGGAYFSVGVLPATLSMLARADFSWYGSALVLLWIEILVAAATIADYLGIEAAMRPVLRDVARYLPPDFEYPEFGRRLPAKVLAAVTIPVSFTAALAAGAGPLVESTTARLGVAVAIAVGMTLTLALLLGRLLARSVASPIERLLEATESVARGNLDVRVPVVAWDEMGSLAKGFNAMVHGLREREALRSAMGSYVHPDIARRVLQEGELLEGVEAEATVLFSTCGGSRPSPTRWPRRSRSPT
jgi:HAMP domain-containing protein